MKILVGAIGHESNTFTPFLTQLEDFHPRYGQDSLAPLRHGAFGGIVTTLQARSDVELIPTLAAHAMPGGVVARAAFEMFKQRLLEPAHDLDGVCLFLHGAMRAEGVDYAENELIKVLRAQIGPRVPITLALDMHANLVAETGRNVNALVAYHNAPHDDTFETGQKAADMLLRLLDGAPLALGFAKVPFLLPGEKAETSVGAMREMMQRVAELEAHPGIVSASLMNGHCWADVPDIGVIAAVVTEGDAARAQAEADRLVAEFWERRADFDFHTEAYSVDEAVRVAMSAPESTVFLSDSGDNPGAGGTTDVTVVLESLLRQGAQNAVVAAIWDAESVAACLAAGVGHEVSVNIGGKLDTRHSKPLPVTGVVRLISDGDTYRGGVREPGRLMRRGPVVVLTVTLRETKGVTLSETKGLGVDVVLSANRLSIEEPAHLRSLGIEPLAYKIVVPKRGYLTTPLHVISPRSILAISPGVTNCDVRQLAYRRVQRPMYPLDEA